MLVVAGGVGGGYSGEVDLGSFPSHPPLSVKSVGG
jgi:hypothetical protein